jgi:hypothetical protein
MSTPEHNDRQASAKYRAMESGAGLASLILLAVALLTVWLYRPSVWFVLGSVAGGSLLFLSWRARISRSLSLSGVYSLLGVMSLLAALTVEIERPLHVLMACGFSFVGTVMFALVAVTRYVGR